jgi:hypothetical protein
LPILPPDAITTENKVNPIFNNPFSAELTFDFIFEEVVTFRLVVFVVYVELVLGDKPGKF